MMEREETWLIERSSVELAVLQVVSSYSLRNRWGFHIVNPLNRGCVLQL